MDPRDIRWKDQCHPRTEVVTEVGDTMSWHGRCIDVAFVERTLWKDTWVSGEAALQGARDRGTLST